MRASLLFVAIAMWVQPANAAYLIVEDGKLMGANGVTVEGGSYDVRFVEGMCEDVFSGCDEPSDFIASNAAAASKFAQALLDEVVVDGYWGDFDSNPRATLGCSLECNLMVPYSSTPYPPPIAVSKWLVSASYARNNFAPPYDHSPGPPPDGVNETIYWLDTADFGYEVWARFTPSTGVPEPSSWALMIIGFGIVSRSIRRRRAAIALSTRGDAGRPTSPVDGVFQQRKPARSGKLPWKGHTPKVSVVTLPRW